MADGIKRVAMNSEKRDGGEVERKRRKNREKERTYKKLERYKW